MDPNARGRSPSASNASHLRHTPSASPHPPYNNQSFADPNLLSPDSFNTLNNTAPSAHFTDPTFTQDFQHQPDYSLGQFNNNNNNNNNSFQTQQLQQPIVPSQSNDVSNHTFLQSAHSSDNTYGFNQPAQNLNNHLTPGVSSHSTTPSPGANGANIDGFPGFDLNQTTFDHNTSLDPALLDPNGLDLFQPQPSQLNNNLDPMATSTLQSHTPTPPHLFPEISHRQSLSPSPHASPNPQAGFQNIGNMGRPRGTSESLDPSSAAYPQGNGNEWLGMGGYRHQRSPSDQLSDISSAHNSPYMQTLDSFDHSSPMLNASTDPSFSDGLGLGQFSLNDPHHAQSYYSPGHSPHISPRLMPQQSELPAFTADNNFGMVPAMSGQFLQTNNEGSEMFPSYGQDSFPSYGNQPTSPSDLGAADQMSPPEISIDYAPPAKQNNVNPRPSRSIGDGETLSPPIRRKLHIVACEIRMY